MVHFSTRFFRSLPVFVFAFTCHQNVSTLVPNVPIFVDYN
jgi:amino acid permease